MSLTDHAKKEGLGPQMELKWDKEVEGVFGVNLDVDVPDDVELIVVCVNTNSGHQPVSVMLPHQVYQHDLERWKGDFERGGKTVHGFTILPVLNYMKKDVPEWEEFSSKHGKQQKKDLEKAEEDAKANVGYLHGRKE